MIRVILADDHAIIRQGLRALIERTDDIRLIGEASDGVTAKQLIAEHQPDIAILDIAMPHLDGLTLADQLIQEHSPAKVIILTTHDDSRLYQQAMQLGVHYFLSKIHAFETLLETIRQAASSQPGRAALQAEQLDSTTLVSFKITEREREVLTLIANGMTNRMIAEHLEISIKTVDRHLTNLMTKLDLHTAAQLSRFALQIGLV